jgi:hypothetical protein
MSFNYSEVEALIGKESDATPALDKVSKSDIRHYCEIIEEDDTPYKKINWGNKNAPPAMIMAWTMPPYWSPDPKEPIEPHELAMKSLDEAGYDNAIGLSMDQEFHNPVKVGDRLSYKVKLAGVSSEEVNTKMGSGYQVDLVYTISNQDGDMVSSHNYTLLKFKSLNISS